MQFRLPAIFFSLCCNLASAAVIDLGDIVWDDNVDGLILVSGNPTAEYSYQQNLFTGPDLNMMLDGGETLAQALANTYGPTNNGSLVYNFPFASGASGTYTQNGTPTPESLSEGSLFSFTATSQSGVAYSGFNSVGSTITLDPTNATMTYETILGNTVTVPTACVTPTTSVIQSPPLGTSNGNTYMAEETLITWQSSVGNGGCTSSPSGTPEPSTFWTVVAACGALRIWRRLRLLCQE